MAEGEQRKERAKRGKNREGNNGIRRKRLLITHL